MPSKQVSPSGEAGDVRDIAAGVVFLASDASRYITGETIRIDGGMAMLSRNRNIASKL